MKSSDRSGGKKALLGRFGGFTLIELMVTIAIGAIVLALAAPALSDLIARNRMTTAVNTFIANLQAARSEAVKRRLAVTLCPYSGDAGDPCADSVNWHTGYVLVAGANEIVRQVGAASAQIAIKTTAAGKTLVYEQDGTSPSPGSNGVTYTFCDAGGQTDPRAVIVSNIGRPETSDKDADGNPLVCP